MAIRTPETVLMPEDQASRTFHEQAGYAQAVTAGGMIYLSGIVAAPASGETGYEPAFRRIFESIAAILARAGASWDAVVDITSFHTDLISQLPALVAVKADYVTPPFAAWTAIGVSRLYTDNGICEIKVVAQQP